jgi:hypothetical protein
MHTAVRVQAMCVGLGEGSVLLYAAGSWLSPDVVQRCPAALEQRLMCTCNVRKGVEPSHGQDMSAFDRVLAATACC